MGVLNERYGKLDIMIDARYSKSRNISPPIYKPTSLPAFYDEAEKHIRALKSLGEDIDHRELLIMLRSKLLFSVLEKLEQQKDCMDYGKLQT